MSRANAIFLKVRRILLGILLVYLVVRPILSLFLLPSGGGEFSGLWIIVLFPHLVLFTNDGLKEGVSLSSGIVYTIAISSLIFFFGLRFFVNKRFNFNIGYCWSIMGFLVLVVLLTASINSFLYPHTSSDWSRWANEAVAKNDPTICIQKVDEYYQENCLKAAAMQSGNSAYCEVNPVVGILADKCKTQVVLFGNISKKICGKDYDYTCVEEKACDKNAYGDEAGFQCTIALLNGYFDQYIEMLPFSAGSTVACDLFKGAPDEQEKIDRCKANLPKLESAL